jgi:hypothetical protein
MSSTPTTASAARNAAPAEQARSADERTNPPPDTRAAFEEALARLQQQRKRGEGEELAPAEAQAQQPNGALTQQPVPADGGIAALSAAAPSSAGSTLAAQELSGMLSSLHMPASPEGPQQWQFQFASDTGLAVQGLTLTGQPGSQLTVHLHANPQAPLRERELSSQRLGELRQRLGERGAPVEALHWSDGDGSGQHGQPR